jgi:hypothetical protein
METTVIEKQEVLTSKVIEILLYQYNKEVADPDEQVLLVESEAHSCFGVGLKYTFYKGVGDMRGHYERGNTLGESATMLWLSHELNKKQGQ